MRLNYETCLVGSKTILVPYRPEHVPKYHEWMKDPALLEATDSEPLSFEEEVAMQASWRDDPDKCTFIVHAKDACDVDETSFYVARNVSGMVGDVNLFMSEVEKDEEDVDIENTTTATTHEDDSPKVQAELDIMVAEHSFRKMGLGRAATCSMLLYGARKLKVHRFFCKINDDNVASIKLFESLGFVQCDYAACFKQVELELIKPLEELEETLGPHGSYEEVKCPLEDP